MGFEKYCIVKTNIFLGGFINSLEIKIVFLLIKGQRIKKLHSEFPTSIAMVCGRCMQGFQIP